MALSNLKPEMVQLEIHQPNHLPPQLLIQNRVKVSFKIDKGNKLHFWENFLDKKMEEAHFFIQLSTYSAAVQLDKEGILILGYHQNTKLIPRENRHFSFSEHLPLAFFCKPA